MKLQLIKIYDTLRDSFWFMPAVMALMSLVAALGTTALDNAIGSEWVKNIGWIWSGGPTGARSVLSTIAGSLMTVISIVFTLTITTLAQTSSHFGPRVLRNFTSDRGNQLVLGTFIATFVYSLFVLRTVRSVDESTFVPYLSVNVGIALALASLAVLIYFIHHVSQSIQAENLIAEVGGEFQEALPRLFPEAIGRDDRECPDRQNDVPDEEEWDNACEIDAPLNGYVQRIDDERVMALACEHDLLLKLPERPGHFVTKGSPLILALPADRVNKEIRERLQRAVVLGVHRTPYQDAGYSVQQLVEIASRALSPGINEPFTALTALDWLGASLRGVAGRTIPSPLRRDDGGTLRVIADPLTFEELAHSAFDPIRIFGVSNPAVAIHLLRTIEDLAPHLRREIDRAALLHHTQAIGQDAQKIANEHDRQHVESHLRRTLRALAKE